MRKLYEIETQIARLIELDGGNSVDPETGEILDSEALVALALERDTKVENCLLVIKNDKAEAEMVDREIKRLQLRKRALDNHREHLTSYVQSWLKGEKFKGELSSVYYRTSKSVVVDDVTKVPEEYIRTITEPKKLEIMQAHKNGLDISHFATIQENVNMIVK